MSTSMGTAEGVANERDLRADLELLQSFSDARETPAHQAEDLGEMAAEASRAVALATRANNEGALVDSANSYMHTQDVATTEAHSHASGTLAAPVPEASMMPGTLSMAPISQGQVVPMLQPAGAPMNGGMPINMQSHSPNTASRQNRQLSTTKRAAQNRAAQRAFRQRKENHIKNLEVENAEYARQAEHYKAVETENATLRQYCLLLQTRLINLQCEVPPPPVGLRGLVPSGAFPLLSPSSSNAQTGDVIAVAAAAESAQQAAQAAEGLAVIKEEQQKRRQQEGEAAAAQAAAEEVTDPMMT